MSPHAALGVALRCVTDTAATVAEYQGRVASLQSGFIHDGVEVHVDPQNDLWKTSWDMFCERVKINGNIRSNLVREAVQRRVKAAPRIYRTAMRNHVRGWA